MNEIHCLSSAQVVLEYSESKIAKFERRDCVVRALAAFCEISYDVSHKFCKDVFKRRNKQGVYATEAQLGVFLKENKNTLFGKEVKTLTNNFTYYGSTKRQMTLLSFIRKHSKGFYMIFVRGHALVLKNGILIGNANEHKHLRRRVEIAYKIK